MKKKILIYMSGIALLCLTIGLTITEKKSLKEKNILAIQEANAKLANPCCGIWSVTVKYGWSGPEITCETGGDYQCKDCECPDD